MKPSTLLASLLLFFIPAFAQQPATEKWDLRRCVEYAIQKNISVRQADLQARYSELTLKQQRASRYPSVNAGLSPTYNFGRNENPTTGVLEDNNYLSAGLNLQTSVSLFNWFSKKNAIAASDLAWKADQAQIKKVQDDVALNVAASYLQVLLARAQTNISRIQVLQTKSQLENTRKRVSAGNLPELDALQLDAQLALDSSNLVTAETNAEQSLLMLKAILNIAADVPFDVATPPVDLIPIENLADLQPANVYELARTSLPRQKVNALKWQSARKSVDAARGAMYPEISLFGGIGTGYAGVKIPGQTFSGAFDTTTFKVNVNGIDYRILSPRFVPTGDFTRIPFGTQINQNFGQNVGINISIPIFNGRTARTNWERAKLDVKGFELLIEQDSLTLKQDIYKAYTDAAAAIQKFNASKKGVEAAEKAVSFSQRRYDLGLLSVYDLINTQNTLLRSKTELILAQYDYVFKMKLLEFYKGQGLKL